MSKKEIKQAEKKQERAFVALVKHVAEREIKGVPMTERERGQRLKKLSKLVIDIESAAEEALYAGVVHDLAQQRLALSPKSLRRKVTK